MKVNSEKFLLSAFYIDHIADLVEESLESEKYSRKEILRHRITIEEILLNWMEELGEIECTFTISRRLGRLYIELITQGQYVNPLEMAINDGLTGTGHSILANMGIMPSYYYENGVNKVVLMLKLKTMGMMLKIAIACLAAFAAAGIILLLPDDFSMAIYGYVFNPVNDIVSALLQLVACPMMFFSIIWGIISMGDTSTLSKIGKVLLRVCGIFLVFSSLLAVIISLPAVSVSFSVSKINSRSLDSLLQLIVGIVPQSLFQPFDSANTMQVVFLAIFMGICILIIGKKIPLVINFADQCNQLFQFLIGAVNTLIPIIVFITITRLLINNSLTEFQSAMTFLILFSIFIVLEIVVAIVYVAAKLHISPRTLMVSVSQSVIIAFTTASSSAAFSVAMSDAKDNLKVDNGLFKFCFPLGLVIFMPSFCGTLVISAFVFGNYSNLAITPDWIAMAVFLAIILSVAAPPVNGGALACYTILFVQLGIPMSMLAIIITLDTIIVDAVNTSTHVGLLELLTALIAKKLNLLDV